MKNEFIRPLINVSVFDEENVVTGSSTNAENAAQSLGEQITSDASLGSAQLQSIRLTW